MIDDRNERELSTADVAAAANRRAEADRQSEQRLHDREIESAPVREIGQERARDMEPALLGPDVVSGFRRQWNEIQTGFVDEPRRAVEEADELVAEAIRQLAQSFAEARTNLEHQWDRGDDVSTEDLRQALQRYRSFFGRLLSV